MNEKHPRFDDKDNGDWYDLLAGHDVPDADPDTRREAESIREAALAWSQTAEPSPQELDRGWQQLRSRLRETGVLSPPRPSRWQQLLESASSLWRQPVWVAVLAATLAGVVLLPPIIHLFSPGIVVTPKSYVIPQEVPVAEPESRARALAAALNAHGVETLVEPLGPGWRLTADLPEQPSAALTAALAEFRLIPPAPPERQLQALFLPPGQ